MTTGMPPHRVRHEAHSTLMTPLETVNPRHVGSRRGVEGSAATRAPFPASAWLRARVAFVLAEAYLEKFGRDNMADIKAAMESVSPAASGRWRDEARGLRRPSRVGFARPVCSVWIHGRGKTSVRDG